ncbi:alpha/beta hydrolase fold domain-containing protein [Pseudonocardia pini]|uniref:alpha/beta hydrolase fold domain-containing protein n=1 Tax=Pseudonocardia pini TaxID=2758030 RepID=UPI0015F05545|nr:alpha/beta hydrolase fold domain-containing protein [Pseudonocardia pini]
MTRGPAADAALDAIRVRADATPECPGVSVVPTTWHGVPVTRYVPPGVSAQDPVLLWFHGGGYRLGTARGFGRWNAGLAVRCGVEVVSVDYRLAPEHPYPEALLDAVLAYTAAGGRRVVVGGESAGGGLAAALLLAVADRDLPAPLGGVLCSPWLDLRNASASFAEDTDPLFPKASADTAAALYLAGHPATDPYASPLLGDWSRQPPLLVQASTTESLREDAVGLAAVAPGARLELYDGLPHAWHIGYPEASGSEAAATSVGRFVAEVTASTEVQTT